MTIDVNDILRRPLYVFDLPHEILVTLHRRDAALQSIPSSPSATPASPEGRSSKQNNKDEGTIAASTSCALCNANFSNVLEQRGHVRSDLHKYNLKQRLKGLKTVNETQFDTLVGDLDESLSGSESDSDTNDDNSVDTRTKNDTLTALLKRQIKLSNPVPVDGAVPEKRIRGSGRPPMLYFASSALPSNISLGIYRALFTNTEVEDEAHIVDILRNKQLSLTHAPKVSNVSNGVPLPISSSGPHFFLCMIGGGHFAAMVVCLTPKVGKKAIGVEERQATVLAHKTFHRYTTRRKQGGAQSANDSAKGAAHSAGSSLRRYNEVALETEIRALLKEWKSMIETSQLIFVRATGTTNRRTLFGPYEGQVLRQNDPRNRTFPFSTRRATQAELMRAFIELTRVKVNEIDEEALAAAAAAETKTTLSQPPENSPKAKPTHSKPKEDETALLHTSQLQALIRRSKAPALLSYLTTHSLSPDFPFHPASSQQNHHAPTPLHLAASTNSPAIVLALLAKATANPELRNADGKPPFDVAGDRPTRDAFRLARHDLGEARWDWASAHVPPPLSKAEADEREERDRQEAERAETARRKAETERLAMEVADSGSGRQGRRVTGRALGVAEKTGAEKREEEVRGLTPELRARLERERRARAAEERIRRLQGGTGSGASGSGH